MPEDVKQKLLALHEENLNLKESYKTATEKLNKAKQVSVDILIVLSSKLKIMQFIKSQDKLFKEQHAANAATVSVSLVNSGNIQANGTQQGTFEEAEASFRSQIKVLEEDLVRQKVGCEIVPIFFN